jgi:hypothetical protein
MGLHKLSMVPFLIIALMIPAGFAFGYSTSTHRLINDKIYVESYFPHIEIMISVPVGACAR